MKWALVLLIATCNTFGDVLTTAGMKRHGAVREFHPTAIGRLVRALSRNRYVLGGIASMTVAFFGLLALLSVADLSFAVPATASCYLMETLLAKLVLKERVSWRRWAGATLVACGVALLAF
jgi:drug/metabolite transporter (DMT)-like permease